MCNLFILILFYDIVVSKLSLQLLPIIINNNAITSRNVNITKNRIVYLLFLVYLFKCLGWIYNNSEMYLNNYCSYYML